MTEQADGPAEERPDGSGLGRVILAATPLGHPGDASPRLATALGECPVIAAEDTRRLHRLAQDLGVSMPGRVVSLHDSVEADRAERLVDDLRAGRDVLVVTDAGMPGVSDPGYRVVRAAVEVGATVTVLPGPTAAIAALVVSGLPVDRFAFEGFLPRRAGDRRRRLADLATEARTMVFFEAPHRIAACLDDMRAAFGGDRPAAIVRELTKPHEEVIRGSLADLAQRAEAGVRGEITVVVGGSGPRRRTGDAAGWAREVAELVAEGVDRRSAIAEVATSNGVPRRDVYDAVVRAKHAAAESASSAP